VVFDDSLIAAGGFRRVCAHFDEEPRREFGGMAIFQERTIPDTTRLAGWAALVNAFGVLAPVRRPSCVSEQHISGSRRQEGAWIVFDNRYWKGSTFADQLTFALRHEDIDLLVLKRVFDAVPKREVEAFVRTAPTSISVRRACSINCAMTKRP
jgi:hypothetical protein